MTWNLLSYEENIMHEYAVSWLYALNKILQINASQKTIKYTLSQKKDKSNTKLFFLANKETDFFWNENLFSNFRKFDT